MCTEHYDEEIHRGHDSGTTRTTSKFMEHEEWQPLQSGPVEQGVRFAIPPDALPILLRGQLPVLQMGDRGARTQGPHPGCASGPRDQRAAVSPTFDLQLDDERYTPGATVAGTVVVRVGGRSRSLEVRLGYVEETDDYLEVATSLTTGHLDEGDLEPGASFRFELPLPPDALPNFTSRHGQLYWRLEVKSDERGRDSHELLRLDVDG